MAVGDYYKVDFSIAVYHFQAQMGNDQLPVIDCDPVKWYILQMFEHIEPLIHLERLADQMIKGDLLYSKVDFTDVGFDEAITSKQQLDDYLRQCLIEFGRNMYTHLQTLGMLMTGMERYKVTRPLHHELYILRRTR